MLRSGSVHPPTCDVKLPVTVILMKKKFENSYINFFYVVYMSQAYIMDVSENIFFSL